MGLVGLDEFPEAGVFLLASGATFEVRPHARNQLVGRRPVELKVDVHVELLEALVAEHFMIGGSEQSLENGVVGWLVDDRSPLDRVERESPLAEVGT